MSLWRRSNASSNFPFPFCFVRSELLCEFNVYRTFVSFLEQSTRLFVCISQRDLNPRERGNRSGWERINESFLLAFFFAWGWLRCITAPTGLEHRATGSTLWEIYKSLLLHIGCMHVIGLFKSCYLNQFFSDNLALHHVTV